MRKFSGRINKSTLFIAITLTFIVTLIIFLLTRKFGVTYGEFVEKLGIVNMIGIIFFIIPVTILIQHKIYVMCFKSVRKYEDFSSKGMKAFGIFMMLVGVMFLIIDILNDKDILSGMVIIIFAFSIEINNTLLIGEEDIIYKYDIIKIEKINDDTIPDKVRQRIKDCRIKQ